MRGRTISRVMCVVAVACFFSSPEALAAGNGRLEVKASPARARVLVDGKPVGSAPVSVDVPAGKHTVRLEAADHRPAERTVRVKAGRTVRLSVKLKPDFGNLQVLVKPAADVTVFLDGIDVGPPPVYLRRISAGTHRVSVAGEGIAPVERKVTIPPGKTASVAISLARRLGGLLVKTVPAKMAVFVDGRYAGSSPVKLSLRPGRHIVEGRLGSATAVKKEVVLRAGKTSRVVLRAAAARSTLVVKSRPSGAVVWLDGRKIGKTPLRTAVPEGVHVFTASVGRRPPPLSGRIEAKEGRKCIVDLDLEHPERSRIVDATSLAALAEAAAEPGPATGDSAPPPLIPIAVEQRPEGGKAGSAGTLEASTPPAARAGSKEGVETKAVPEKSAVRKIASATPVGQETAVKAPQPAVEATATKRAEPSPPMSTWRLLAWIGTGTAGAAAVTSTLLFVFGASKRSDADAQWEIVKDTSLPKPRRDAAYLKATDLDTQADRLFLGAWITGGFTIAAAAATVYLFVAKPATEQEPVVTLLPSPDGVGVSLGLSF